MVQYVREEGGGGRGYVEKGGRGRGCKLLSAVCAAI